MKTQIFFFIFALFFLPLAAQQIHTLDSLLEAASKNPILQIANIETMMAKTMVTEAVGASLPKIEAGLYGQFDALPQNLEDSLPGFANNVNGIIDYINVLGSIQSIPGLPSFAEPNPRKWAAVFAAELTQPLFTWGKIAFSIKLAKMGVQAKQIQQLAAERELLTQVVLQTTQLHYLLKIEEITAKQQKNAERLKKIAEENASNKIILSVDAYGAALMLLETQTAREQLKAQIDSVYLTLRESTQIKELRDNIIDFSFIPQNFSQLTRPKIEEMVKYIHSTSDEAQLLNLQTSISNEQRKIIASDAWAKPDIGLKLGYKIGTKPYNSSSDDIFRWNFTAAIAINSTIFSGGQSIARLKRAGLDTQKTVYEKYRDLAQLEIKLRELNATIDYKLAYTMLYEQQLEQSIRLLEIKKNEFAAGYIEERDYLSEYAKNLVIQTKLLQNNLSFFADYCIYHYICGKFPKDYLQTR